METLTPNNGAPVLVTAATLQELDHLFRAIGPGRQDSLLFREVHTGAIDGVSVVLAVTGMGKVNAASVLTLLVERYRPRLVINTGCAGAYEGSGLEVGDLAVASVEVYGDDGVISPAGWEPLDLIGIPLLELKGRRYFNEFPLSFSASEKAMQLAAALGISVKRGRFVTVSTCSGSASRGRELADRFDSLCENMEGAAVAHVSLMYGIDCMEVRGISNLVEDRDLSRWNIPRAVENAQRFVLKYIQSLAPKEFGSRE
ncbi:futalosine hydrolase [Geobacter sp. AOG1]|uniref:futalosine hydrolase n=1 Tax=Geobacter sp. AOG1 TaxID=1566346 RepID=UPI001CC531F3|nr:futalosine hydrolase [Geobacter sp. AOG1]GFE57263.1 futalosine hydrolase [Geobacter sp. AOG1]